MGMTRETNAAMIADLMERLGRLVRAGEHAHGLNPAQWEALRYLGRANRFSRFPGALCDYLGATKGTVSQTLIALERKGLVERLRDPDNGRKVALGLTGAGAGMLRNDPLGELSAVVADLDDAAMAEFARALTQLLEHMVARRGNRTFGQCHTCRFFAKDAGEARGTHRCQLLQTDLSDRDAGAVCVEHEAA